MTFGRKNAARTGGGIGRVAALRDGGPGIAYACPGSELQGLEIMLFLDEPDRLSGLVPFEVRGDSRVRCVGSSQTFSRFLARHPARIGISAEGFERLYGTVKPGATLPSRKSTVSHGATSRSRSWTSTT